MTTEEVKGIVEFKEKVVAEIPSLPAKRRYTKRSTYWTNPLIPKGRRAHVVAKVKAVKKNASRVPVMFRQGSWEVKKGNGLWKIKFHKDLSEAQVRKSLALEYPGSIITRYRVGTNGK